MREVIVPRRCHMCGRIVPKKVLYEDGEFRKMQCPLCGTEDKEQYDGNYVRAKKSYIDDLYRIYYTIFGPADVIFKLSIHECGDSDSACVVDVLTTRHFTHKKEPDWSRGFSTTHRIFQNTYDMDWIVTAMALYNIPLDEDISKLLRNTFSDARLTHRALKKLYGEKKLMFSEYLTNYCK